MGTTFIKPEWIGKDSIVKEVMELAEGITMQNGKPKLSLKKMDELYEEFGRVAIKYTECLRMWRMQ